MLASIQLQPVVFGRVLKDEEQDDDDFDSASSLASPTRATAEKLPKFPSDLKNRFEIAIELATSLTRHNSLKIIIIFLPSHAAPFLPLVPMNFPLPFSFSISPNAISPSPSPHSPSLFFLPAHSLHSLSQIKARQWPAGIKVKLSAVSAGDLAGPAADYDVLIYPGGARYRWGVESLQMG